MSDPAAEAFEAGLRANPDDLAGWSAYADYLAERGDPRGEFMRVQLALEDETVTRDHRHLLKVHEAQILAAHRRVLAGQAVERLFLAEAAQPMRYTLMWRRGWLDEIGQVGLKDQEMELTHAPELRWLRSLQLDYAEGLGEMVAAPFTPVLRSFTLGSGEYSGTYGSDGLFEFLAAAPRLERLILCAADTDTERLFALPMPGLRELGVHCCEHYPADRLADNPSLTGLRRLGFHPHAWPGDGDPFLTAADLAAVANSPHLRSLVHLQFNCCDAGDEGCRILAGSPLLARLEVLDLSQGAITDDGALVLAQAIRRRASLLKTVLLEDNALTESGLAALRATGVTVNAPDQHAPGDTDYLFNGDME